VNNESEPAQTSLPVNKDLPMRIWVDASSIAVGVALEVDNEIIVDASLLRKPNDSKHINMR